MKFLVILLFYCYSLQDIALGQGCFQPAISFEVLDSAEANTQVFSVEVPDVKGISNEFPYLDAKVDNGSLTISTTDEFLNIEQNYGDNGLNDYESQLSNGKLTITVDSYKITCSDDTPMDFSISFSVTDTNNNEPKLDNNAITCKVPVPIMAQTDLTLYGCKVTAWDLDMTNSAIKIESTDSEDFDVTTVPHPTENKTYLSYDIHIQANKAIISYDQNITFNVVFTDFSDSYPDTQNTSLEVTIEFDLDGSLDFPSFSAAYVVYNADKDLLNITSETDLVIKTLKNNGVFVLTGKYSDTFEVSKDENNVVLITLKQGAAVPNEKNIFLSLEYNTDYKAVTTIVIQSPNHGIEYDQVLYFANYTRDNTIELITPIIITPHIEGLSFNLTGDPENENKIGIEYDEASGEYTISLIEPLVTENRTIIILTVTAFDDTESISANLAIHVPEPLVLEFSLPLYTASSEITDFDKPLIDITLVPNPIEVLNFNNIEEVKILIEGEGSEMFNIQNIEDEWKVIANEISQDLLTQKTEISFKITATDQKTQAESVLAITLPKGVSEAPIFSQLSYSATYQNDKVQLPVPIFIFNKNNLDLKITPDSHTENFDIRFSTTGGWTVNVIEPLSESDLSKSNLILTLTASETNNYFVGEAVLIIDLTKPEARCF